MRTIGDVLKMNGHALWSISPDSSVDNALKLMAEEQVGALPIVDDGKLVGVITDKDCIKDVVIKGKSIEKTTVKEVEAIKSTTTSPAQSVEECLALMTENQLQHLPVVSNGSLVGFVSMNDLFRTIIDDQKDMIYRLDNYVLGIDFGK